MTSPKKISIDAYYEGVLAGDIAMLGRAITLVESTLPTHRKLADKLIELCLPHAGKSVRIGITGVPGVGKSTFIEKFGLYLLREQHKRIAVLAVGPTSSFSKGSILGDKTRMEELSVQKEVFIRPSPSGTSLGGVARRTRESIYLCEAAGYDTILIETEGVGQSETAVHSMVDFCLLLMLSVAGDELQGIKRGIMEMADALIITKADGHNKPKAQLAAVEYRRAMHMLPPHPGGWIPETGFCSAYENSGMDKVWDIITRYLEHVQANNYFLEKRKQQAVYWLDATLEEQIRNLFFANEQVQKDYEVYKQQLLDGKITSYKAADELMQCYQKLSDTRSLNS